MCAKKLTLYTSVLCDNFSVCGDHATWFVSRDYEKIFVFIQTAPCTSTWFNFGCYDEELSSILSFKFMVFFGASFSIQSVCADTFLFVTFFSPVCALHFGNKKWFDLNWNILKDMKLFVTSYIADNSAFGLQKMIYVINTTFRIGLVKIFASSIHCSTTLLILSSCFLYFYSASIGGEMVLLKDDAQHLRISL